MTEAAETVEEQSVFTKAIAQEILDKVRGKRVGCPFTRDQLLNVLLDAEDALLDVEMDVNDREFLRTGKALEHFEKHLVSFLDAWRALKPEVTDDIGFYSYSEIGSRFYHAGRANLQIAESLSLMETGVRAAIEARDFRIAGRDQCPDELLAFVRVIHDAWVKHPSASQAFGHGFKLEYDEKSGKDKPTDPTSTAAIVVVTAINKLRKDYYGSETIRTAMRYAKKKA